MSKNELRIWINAFIPKDIPGLTITVPAGLHAGKTMINGPTHLIHDCFLTDQRSFNNDPSASCRMHSMAVINLGGLSLKSELHRCDETIEIDCEDGDEECNSSSSTSRIRIEDFKGVTVKELNINSVEFRFLGEASNPCFKGAPDIDWDIVVSVIFNSPSDEIEVLVKGCLLYTSDAADE